MDDNLQDGCDGAQPSREKINPEGVASSAPYVFRKRPAHLPVLEQANRSNIVLVTVCSQDRKPIFANDEVHQLVMESWRTANHWRVGRYVVMPDHIHFFCAPGKRDYPPLKEWIRYWKSLVARAVRECGPLGKTVAVERDPPVQKINDDSSRLGGTGSTPSGSVAEKRDLYEGMDFSSSSIWQRDFWDTQLRCGDSYSEKWNYVRNNPVRAGLVAAPELWPFSGEMTVLRWTE